MTGDKIKELVAQGSLIGYTDPQVLVSVAYYELWENALFWCSTENGAPGGPHVLEFSDLREASNQVNFYQRNQLVATLAPYDEWPEIGDTVSAYQNAWKIWNADQGKKLAAEQYWHQLGKEIFLNKS